MKEFQEKNKAQHTQHKSRKKYSKTLLLFMFIVFIFLTKGVFSVYLKEKESDGEIDRVKGEKIELEKRYANIVGQNEALKSSGGVESEIRNKFDVVKEGEGVIIIVEKEIPVIEEDKRGVLKKFWDSVKGVFGSSEVKNSQGTSTVIQGR